jgi:ABC-type multidrug transport system permease subunit
MFRVHNSLISSSSGKVVAYKLGGVLVGGSLLWFREELGHFSMWLVFGSLYFLTVGLLLSLSLVTPRAESGGQR